MLVGAPVDAGGQTVFVRLEWTRPADGSPPETVAGPVVARVRTEVLNELTTRPDPYVAAVAVTSLGASIEHVTLASGEWRLALERAGAAWATPDEPLLPDESEAIDQLLELAGQAHADAVRVSPPEGRETPAGVVVRLAAGDGTPPTDLRLAADGEDAVVTIGPVTRHYTGRAALVASLEALLARLAPPGAG
jgi:hypothetical protein